MTGRAAAIALSVLSLVMLVRPGMCSVTITPTVQSVSPVDGRYSVSTADGTVVVSGQCTVLFSPTGTVAGEVYATWVTGAITLGSHRQEASWYMYGAIDAFGIGEVRTFSVGNSWSFGVGDYGVWGTGQATTSHSLFSGFSVLGPTSTPPDTTTPTTGD